MKNKSLDNLIKNPYDKENWEVLGRVLSGLSDSPKKIASLMYDFLEEHNFHALCSVFNWIFNLYDGKYTDDLNNIKGILNGLTYDVKISQNDDLSWKTKRYTLKVTFEEVDNSVETEKDSKAKVSWF